MAIIGAILGDIAGSQFEFDRIDIKKTETCDLFSDDCMFTDDTVMTLAVKYAIDNNLGYREAMQHVGIRYPGCGYGGRFYEWIVKQHPNPYNSWGNGSAMRASYIGEHFENLEDVIAEAEKSAIVSHNHPEGIKGAVTTAVCIWMAKHGKSKDEIRKYALAQYPDGQYKYTVNSDWADMEKNYQWDVSCQGSVPVAIKCFLETDSYEAFLRRVIRLECDSDTICCIGGGIAEEFYGTTGLDNEILLKMYLDEYLYCIFETGKEPANLK